MGCHHGTEHTFESQSGSPGPGGPSDRLASLTADVDELASEDLNTLTDVALVEEALELRRLVDRLEGQWLQRLAAIDAWGAAGAEQGIQAPSTASWLRNRLQMGASAATSAVRTARALFRGPLTGTAAALTAGEVSVAHASALTHGTSDLPTQVAAEAEPVLLEAARRMDPPRLRRVLGHLQQVADPDGADRDSERRHGRRGRWLAPTFAGMVALQGLLEAEAGHIVLAALEPLARPHSAEDERRGDQRRADALCVLARRNLESGQLPTRVQAAMAPVAPDPGGAPSQPLDVGRASRVITPAQRSALAVRDGGCVFPDCARPLAWCEGHHLVPWQEGGPTDLANLALLGRQHHRTVHEGGWQLTRGPDGRFTATSPHRPRRHPPPHRRHPTAA